MVHGVALQHLSLARAVLKLTECPHFRAIGEWAGLYNSNLVRDQNLTMGGKPQVDSYQLFVYTSNYDSVHFSYIILFAH